MNTSYSKSAVHPNTEKDEGQKAGQEKKSGDDAVFRDETHPALTPVKQC